MESPEPKKGLKKVLARVKSINGKKGRRSNRNSLVSESTASLMDVVDAPQEKVQVGKVDEVESEECHQDLTAPGTPEPTPAHVGSIESRIETEAVMPPTRTHGQEANEGTPLLESAKTDEEAPKALPTSWFSMCGCV